MNEVDELKSLRIEEGKVFEKQEVELTAEIQRQSRENVGLKEQIKRLQDEHIAAIEAVKKQIGELNANLLKKDEELLNARSLYEKETISNLSANQRINSLERQLWSSTSEVEELKQSISKIREIFDKETANNNSYYEGVIATGNQKRQELENGVKDLRLENQKLLDELSKDNPKLLDKINCLEKLLEEFEEQKQDDLRKFNDGISVHLTRIKELEEQLKGNDIEKQALYDQLKLKEDSDETQREFVEAMKIQKVI
jgi:predicted RNase H-like nuclease (RuvC/YqgF family)